MLVELAAAWPKLTRPAPGKGFAGRLLPGGAKGGGGAFMPPG
jgi:hypothetical protein